jgi:hypothetical protein
MSSEPSCSAALLALPLTRARSPLAVSRRSTPARSYRESSRHRTCAALCPCDSTHSTRRVHVLHPPPHGHHPCPNQPLPASLRYPLLPTPSQSPSTATSAHRLALIYATFCPSHYEGAFEASFPQRRSSRLLSATSPLLSAPLPPKPTHTHPRPGPPHPGRKHLKGPHAIKLIATNLSCRIFDFPASSPPLICLTARPLPPS